MRVSANTTPQDSPVRAEKCVRITVRQLGYKMRMYGIEG